MAEERLRGAIVGFGNVARNGHLPGWRARTDCQIVAATDVRPDQGADLSDVLPGARWYDSLATMLVREAPDFVDVCTPPAMHAEAIAMALEHGAHVLCEKPLVSRFQDLPALLRQAQAQGRVLHCVHNWMAAAPIKKLAALVRQGAIGEVRRLSWRTIRSQPAVTVPSNDGNWRTNPDIAGGGILVDHGWHALYVVCALVGARPVAVRAVLENRVNADRAFEDTATVDLAFDHANTEIFLTWAGDGRDNTVEVVGADGTLSLTDNVIRLDRPGDRMNGERWTFDEGLTAGSHHPDWFGDVADDFISAIRSGRGAAAGNIRDAALCAYVIERARESDALGGKTIPIQWDEIPVMA